MRFRNVLIFLLLGAIGVSAALSGGKIMLPDGVGHFILSFDRIITSTRDELFPSPIEKEKPPVIVRKQQHTLSTGAGIEEAPRFHCRPQKKRAITQNVGATIYKWVDEKGVSHFSDQQPEKQVAAQSINFDEQLEYFNLNLHADYKGFSAHFKDRLTTRVEKSYQFLAMLVPPSLLSKVDVNLWVFNSQHSYQSFWNQHASGLSAGTDGFHTTKGNIAAVWRKTDDQVLSTSVHESVHVMNAEMFGHIPRWLNEGMAEYMEDIHVFGQSAKITVADDWLRQIQRKRLSLEYVLQASDDHWKGSMRSDLYAHSWAVVYFLMSSNDGRELLGNFLKASADNPCQVLDGNTYVMQRYPGGIGELERKFGSWLRGMKSAHRI